MAKVSIELPSGGPAFYFGGDVVQATVIVECTAPFQTRSLYVDIYGRISTEVEETEIESEFHHGHFKVRPKKKTYKSTRRLLNKGKTLLGVAWTGRKNGSTVQLNPGRHVYAVEFRLPASLPPSMSLSPLSAEASVKYQLRAWLDAPGTFSFNKDTTLTLPVGGYNQPWSQLGMQLSPASRHGLRTTKAFLLQSGRRLELVGRLPRKAFYKGDTVPVQVVVKNGSSKDVRAVRFSLRRCYTIMAHGKNQTDSRTISISTESRAISAGAEFDETISIKLPSPPETSCDDALLKITFQLTVELVMSSLLAGNLTLHMPITLLRQRRGGIPGNAVKSATTATTNKAKAAAPPAAAAAAAAAAPIDATVSASGNFKSHTFKSGNVYEGEWSNGAANGHGRMVLKSGSVYEGNFLANRFSGLGRMVVHSGSIYEGEFKESAFHGRGKMIMASDKSVYTGQYEKGLRHGVGSVTYVSGDVLKGTWHNNVVVDGQYFASNPEAEYGDDDDTNNNAGSSASASVSMEEEESLAAQIDMAPLRDVLPRDLVSALEPDCANSLASLMLADGALGGELPVEPMDAAVEEAGMAKLRTLGDAFIAAYEASASANASVTVMEQFAHSRLDIRRALCSRAVRVTTREDAIVFLEWFAASLGARVLLNLGTNMESTVSVFERLWRLACATDTTNLGDAGWLKFTESHPALACVLLNTLTAAYRMLGLNVPCIELSNEVLRICEAQSRNDDPYHAPYRHAEQALAYGALLSARAHDLDMAKSNDMLAKMLAAASKSDARVLESTCESVAERLLYVHAVVSRNRLVGADPMLEHAKAVYTATPEFTDALTRIKAICERLGRGTVEWYVTQTHIASLEYSVGLCGTADFRETLLETMRAAVRLASHQLLMVGAIALGRGHATPIPVRRAILLKTSQLLRQSGAATLEMSLNSTILLVLDASKEDSVVATDDQDDDGESESDTGGSAALMLAMCERMRAFYELSPYENDRRQFMQEIKSGNMHVRLAKAAGAAKDTVRQKRHEQCALVALGRGITYAVQISEPLSSIHLDVLGGALQSCRTLAPKHIRTLRLMFDVLGFVNEGRTRANPALEQRVQAIIGYILRDRGERTQAVKWFAAALNTAQRIMQAEGKPWVPVPPAMLDDTFGRGGGVAMGRGGGGSDEGDGDEDDQDEMPPAYDSIDFDLGGSTVDANGRPVVVEQEYTKKDASAPEQQAEEGVALDEEEEEETVHEEKKKKKKLEAEAEATATVTEETPPASASMAAEPSAPPQPVEPSAPLADASTSLLDQRPLLTDSGVQLLEERALWHRDMLGLQYAALANRNGISATELALLSERALVSYVQAVHAAMAVLEGDTMARSAEQPTLASVVARLGSLTVSTKTKGITRRLWSLLGVACASLADYLSSSNAWLAQTIPTYHRLFAAHTVSDFSVRAAKTLCETTNETNRRKTCDAAREALNAEEAKMGPAAVRAEKAKAATSSGTAAVAATAGDAKTVVWMKDSEAKQCLDCARPFGMLRRRHHCRMCGRIFCADCAPSRVCEALGTDPQRVCVACHKA